MVYITLILLGRRGLAPGQEGPVKVSGPRQGLNSDKVVSLWVAEVLDRKADHESSVDIGEGVWEGLGETSDAPAPPQLSKP